MNDDREMGVPPSAAHAAHAAHAGHDPLAIAGLLDRDVTASDRAVAGALVATCPECAALHADLLALSSAALELSNAVLALPTPPRKRDFRLTAADAARLSAAPGAEPVTPSSRLSGVMTDIHRHASHDTLLVASLADHSSAGPERDRATALVESCTLCAGLHDDLIALSAAIRDMPTPPRPRAYTLGPADAARVRPGGWRRLIAGIGTARDGFSRPLAVGLTTLGLAGLLVATVPSILTTGNATGASAATGASSVADGASAQELAKDSVSSPGPSLSDMAVQTDGPRAAAAMASPAATAADAAAVAPTLQGATATDTSQMPVQSPDDGTYTKNGEAQNGSLATLADQAPGAGERSGPSTMIVVSGTMLIVGLGLFAIRWRARRLR